MPGPMFLLFFLFLYLKLIGTIAWSWWFITMPLWGGFAIVLAILIIIFFAIVLIGAIALIAERFEK